MREYIAHYLVDIQKSLMLCVVENTTDEEMTSCLTFVREQARSLGLRSTEQGVMRLVELRRTKKLRQSELDSHIHKFLERFHDDIVSLVFFYLPSDKLAYYEETTLFGEHFKQNFPIANSEVIEAGSCFAFGRYTACIFHLMRSLEVALRVLFQKLGLPRISTSGARNWNGILKQIRDKLDADNNIPDYDFYDSLYVFLAAAKNPFRNAMHVDATYSEEGARMVFDAVGSFMRHAAEKLKESP
jgi:hypothetical protein